MKRIRTFAAVLAAVTLLCAAAAGFTDISGHWAEENITRMADAGFIAGYPDGSFRPDAQISRAEFLTLLLRTVGLESYYKRSDFLDTQGHWAEAAIASGEKLGVISAGGSFYPDAAITRQDMAGMLYKLAELSGLSLQKSYIPYDDDTSINENLKNAVMCLRGAYIMSGKTGNSFDPLGGATRAEAAAVIERLLEYAGENPGAPD